MSDKVSYVQVTGNGDFTKIGRQSCPQRFVVVEADQVVPAGDDGGELDVSEGSPDVFVSEM
jgi:hypothetical protein